MSGYEISCDPSRLDFSVIYGFVAKSYWAANIPEETMKKAIRNSLCFGVYTKEGRQVGFARLITDRATFAYLADVFILEEYRGKGLSKLLMEKIVSHPELTGLRRILLVTRDSHGLYAKFGFNPLEKPEGFMQRFDPYIYQVTTGIKKSG